VHGWWESWKRFEKLMPVKANSEYFPEEILSKWFSLKK